ncbi:polysaccharide deacetylase family protein [Aquicoccus sp. SU-CL01552]|uniref:polysaccharide deacetylase family protein n=1 Tax=Aquicoccus sp. SU-CL01552 TaxID=3127656 RepID=UPI0031079765
MTGKLVISLDFELLWGVRDHADRNSYGENVLGGRAAIPRILDLFAEHGVRATWATVGFLFCEDKDELIESLPAMEDRPAYGNAVLSNYSYLSEVGQNEKDDPYYFAPSLVRRISQTPGQEIGTHTFSHFYCLEDGATSPTFAADLSAAIAIAARKGIALRSIVFPRNQYSDEHLRVCEKAGIKTYRGNPSHWAYRAAKGAEQTPARRALRLVDAYSGVLGSHAHSVAGDKGPTVPRNTPASRFLRPCAGKLAPFHGRHIDTIKRGMTNSAKLGHAYHLWWHPHNFGVNTEANLDGLRDIVTHFRSLKDAFGMQSASMEHQGA